MENLYGFLKFPVVWIDKKEVRASYDEVHFRTCDAGLYSGGFRKAGIVIDSSMLLRAVISSRKIGYAPPLRGFRLPGLRHYFLEFQWSDDKAEVVTLDAVKRLIIDSRRRSGMYVGMAGEPSSYEKEILNLSSFESLIARFGRPSKTTFLKKLWAGPFDG